ncbi:MAG: YedE-related selenium metabolism membrane protein [Deltaproteobacteria bacterium]|nr:YedE-related selenium metabolism membrane protein [Deltaproteobacteria bacterium]
MSTQAQTTPRRTPFCFFATRTGIIFAGALIGLIACLLALSGNPVNMGICVACFIRDIAGALGLHRAGVVQYLRPEIPAFVLGSFLAALTFKEFKSRGGSSPVIRFVLGAFAMIGALVFLGCPWRAILRLAGGDLNAISGLAGLAAGIGIGVLFLKNGYSLGRSHAFKKPAGLAAPVIMAGLLAAAIAKPAFLFASTQGPGSMRASLLISICAGLVIGWVAQRSRFCTMGAFRDLFLMRDWHLMSGVAAFFAVVLVFNIARGAFTGAFAAQSIAHSQHLWNVLGMVLAGLAFALGGGCPGRQVFLSGEGDSDAFIFFAGMLTGAALAHNFLLASAPDTLKDGALIVGGPGTNGMIAVGVGLIVCLIIGFSMRKRWK